MTPCPTCSSRTEVYEYGQVLGRHRVTYMRCSRCRMIFLPDPHWLPEAYGNAISHGDIGLLRRCRRHSDLATAFILSERLRSGSYLDWAGGYGTLTQMMRDRGFDYWHHDPYAEAIFAREFLDDGRAHYDMISAFEVLEHLAQPAAQLEAVTARTDLFLFSTRLLPKPAPPVGEWWYFDPSSGQHISFHTEASLRHLATDLGFRLTTNGVNWHVFHREPLQLSTRVLFSATLPRARAALQRTRRRLQR